MRTFPSLLVVTAFLFQVNATSIHKRDAALDIKDCSASLEALIPIFAEMTIDLSHTEGQKTGQVFSKFSKHTLDFTSVIEKANRSCCSANIKRLNANDSEKIYVQTARVVTPLTYAFDELFRRNGLIKGDGIFLTNVQKFLTKANADLDKMDKCIFAIVSKDHQKDLQKSNAKLKAQFAKAKTIFGTTLRTEVS